MRRGPGARGAGRAAHAGTTRSSSGAVGPRGRALHADHPARAPQACHGPRCLRLLRRPLRPEGGGHGDSGAHDARAAVRRRAGPARGHDPARARAGRVPGDLGEPRRAPARSRARRAPTRSHVLYGDTLGPAGSRAANYVGMLRRERRLDREGAHGRAMPVGRERARGVRPDRLLQRGSRASRRHVRRRARACASGCWARTAAARRRSSACCWESCARPAGPSRCAGRCGTVPQTERSRLDYPVSALDVALMGALPRLDWWRRPGARSARLRWRRWRPSACESWRTRRSASSPAGSASAC